MKSLNIALLVAINQLVTFCEDGSELKIRFGKDCQYGDYLEFYATISLDSNATVRVFLQNPKNLQVDIIVNNGIIVNNKDNEDARFFENLEGFYTESAFIEAVKKWLKKHPFLTECYSQDE